MYCGVRLCYAVLWAQSSHLSSTRPAVTDLTFLLTSLIQFSQTITTTDRAGVLLHAHIYIFSQPPRAGTLAAGGGGGVVKEGKISNAHYSCGL